MKKYSVVIVGGGSTWTPGILKALIKNLGQFDLANVTLFDIDEQRQAIIGEFAKVLFKAEAPNVNFTYTTDKNIAYRGVDFVFCQMRVGGYPMRELDEKIPLKMGLIGQETCGAGGFAYGMRSIAPMITMVKDVREHSPNAWIINYTNPAAIVALALKKAFPNDKRLINICDQPVNLLRSYERLLGRPLGKVEPAYFGLNHFGWFTHLYDEQGVDLVEEIKTTIKKKGFKPADAEQRDQSWLDTYAMVEDMVADFPDYLPNTYLQYYLYPQYKVAKMDANHTRANEVMAGREKKVFDECKLVAQTGRLDGVKLVHNDAHGDMIVEVATSIAHNLGTTAIVMVENNGIVANLDDDVMIEVAATVTTHGLQPYAVGKIATFYKGLIEAQHAYEKLTVEAFFEQSYQKALMALTLNRTIVDAKIARRVLDELIKANKDYFPPLR